MPAVSLAPWQMAALYNPYMHFAMWGGVACVAPDTLVETINGPREISKLQENDLVVSVGTQGLVLVPCGKPFVKGRARLIRIEHERGSFVAHERHLIASSDGSYRYAADLFVGSELYSFFSIPSKSSEEFDQREFLLNAHYFCEINAGLMGGYFASNRRYGRSRFFSLSRFRSTVHRQDDERILRHLLDSSDTIEHSLIYSHRDQSLLPSYEQSFSNRRDYEQEVSVNFHAATPAERISDYTQSNPLFQSKSACRPLSAELVLGHEYAVSRGSSSFKYSLCKSRVLSITLLNDDQEFWDVQIPGTENYLAEGAVHHNTGKTFTGSQFAIFHIINHPDKTGLLAANNHDQLSQATLRELFYWLDAYGLEYVVDRLPPDHWNIPRRFKTYRNILSVRNPRNGMVSHAFVRILSDADALRGIEISWYWLDETRDTPDDTHKVVLSRLRETNYMRGIITTTTNGEDWAYQRFVKGAKRNDFLYGSMHVKTIESVKAGIITPEYYESMARSFSPLYAAQELEAQHVNVLGGRAYYSAGAHNQRSRAPWGDEFPSRERPLIVGCDFNFSPAPCMWMIGQCGPNFFGPNGEHWASMIHWFGEISEAEMSSTGMTMIVLQRYPEFFYRIYGDCSGGVGTTSNAGVTDYDQIAQVFQQAGAPYSIDYFQSDESQNPRVRSRVENMNVLFKNSLGETRMTYNPQACPHFHDDLKVVGWRPTVSAGRGKLSDGGDFLRTHASDAAGYACYKVFPPMSSFRVGISVPSAVRSEYGLV